MNNNCQKYIVGELRNWRKQFCDPDGTHVVWGFIYGDTRNRFPDGHWIHTAKVDRIEGDLLFTISGSIYRLVGDRAGPDINPWGL